MRTLLEALHCDFLETLYLLFFFKRVAFNALSNQPRAQSYKVANSHEARLMGSSSIHLASPEVVRKAAPSSPTMCVEHVRWTRSVPRQRRTTYRNVQRWKRSYLYAYSRQTRISLCPDVPFPQTCSADVPNSLRTKDLH